MNRPVQRFLWQFATLIACLCLDPVSASAAVLSQVESGTATSSGNGTITVPLATTVDPTRAFLMFSSRHDNNTPGGSMLRGEINGAGTQLVFTRATNQTNTITIQWYVAEFTSGVTVQRGSFTQNATVNDIGAAQGFAGVAATNQAFVTWSKTPNTTDGIFSDDDPVLCDLTSTTNLQCRTQQANANHTIAWQVIEFTNPGDINVQRNTIIGGAMTGGTTEINEAITAVDVNNTMVLVGYNITGSSGNIGSKMLRAQLTSSTNILIDRSNASGDSIQEISWQAIEFLDGTTVQRGTENFTTASGTPADMSWTHTGANRTAHAVVSIAPSGGTITAVRSAQGSVGNGTTVQFNINGAGSDKLMVGISIEETDTTCDTDGAINTATYDGVGLTLVPGSEVRTDSAGFCMRTQLWYLDNPSVGSDQLSIITAGTTRAVNVAAVMLNNAAAGDPENVATNSNNTGVNAITTSISTLTANAMLVDMVGNGNTGDYTPGAGQTEQEEVDGFSSMGSLSTKIVAAPVTFNETTKNIAINAVDTTSAIAFTSVQPVGGQNMGRSDKNNDDIIGVGSFTATLTSAIELTLQRDNASANADVGWFVVEFNKAAQPLAYYQMDEATWGVIADVSGNSNDGSLVGNPANVFPVPTPVSPPSAIAGDPGTCGYGDFHNNTNNQIHAVNTTVVPGNQGSITFWFNNKARWRTNGDRLLFDASQNLGNNNADKHFFLVRRNNNNGSLRFRLEDSNDTDLVATATGLNFLAGEWVHVGVTWDLPNDFMEIYVNGTSVSTGNTNTNGTIGNVQSIYIGDNRDTGTGGGGWSNDAANGYIDEFKIYDTVVSSAQIASDIAATHPCTPTGLAYYAISIPSSPGLTCDPLVVQIDARDSGGINVDPAGTTTIQLSTEALTPGSITWAVTNPLVNTGAFTDNGDGTADYTFTGTESSVQFNLSYPIVETFDIDVTDGTFTDQDGVAEDEDAVFVEAAFRFTNASIAPPGIVPIEAITTRIAGKDSNSAGFAQQPLFIQAIRTDQETGACTTIFQNQAVAVEFASECNNPATCIAPAGPGSQLRVQDNASSYQPAGVNNNGAVANYGAVTLQFDANSAAPLNFYYPDVGQIKLYARYDLDSPNGFYMIGETNSFIVRPFGFDIDSAGLRAADWLDNGALDDSTGTNLSYAADADDSVFASAGNSVNTFPVTLRAVMWDRVNNDDTDNDGVPNTGVNLTNNSTTPNFGQESATELVNVTVGNVRPTNVGNLFSGTNLDFSVNSVGSGLSGTLTIDLAFDEVGIIDLTAALADGSYLTSGSAAAATHENFGRFIPDRLTVTDNGPVLENGCVVGNFTYMDQAFYFTSGNEPALTVTAVNEAGSPTVNYGDGGTSATDFWKLPTVLDRSYDDNGVNNGSNFAGAALASVTISGEDDFTDGQAVLTVSNVLGDRDMLTFGRDTVDISAGDGAPFTASIDLLIDTSSTVNGTLHDSDGVCFDGNDDGTCDDYLNMTNAAGGTPLSLAELRFGRFSIGTAIGSELLPISVPLQTEYFNGSSFVLNTEDDCTAIDLANDILLDNTGSPVAGDSVMTIGGGVSQIDTTLFQSPTAGGDTQTSFLASGEGNTGYIDILGSLPCGTTSGLHYLCYDWDDTDSDGLENGPYDDNPTGRVDFGLFEGPNEYIYIREPW